MVKRSKFNDFKFIKEIKTKPNTPDFEGYYIKQMRETNHTIKNKTKAIYKELKPLHI